jgi:glycerophosphoryl diester phosphodiesterase
VSRSLTSPPRVSWHRGGSEFEESASLAAFVAAARYGAECIEVDVRETADGVLVCVHDDAVPGLGRVVDLRYGDLDTLARERVVTLERFCDALDEADPSRASVIHLDLKDRGYEIRAVDTLIAHERTQFVTTSLVDSIALVRTERPLIDGYLTIGTSREGLSRWQRVRLRSGETFPMATLARCHATGIAVHYALATPLLRWWCRRRGLAIVVWTVDRPAFVEQWLQRDIDVLTTNRPLFALRRRAAFVAAATGGTLTTVTSRR